MSSCSAPCVSEATRASTTPDAGSILAFDARTGSQVDEWPITPEQSVMYTSYTDGSAVTRMARVDDRISPEKPYKRKNYDEHLNFSLVLPGGYKLDVETNAADTLIGMQVVG